MLQGAISSSLSGLVDGHWTAAVLTSFLILAADSRPPSLGLNQAAATLSEVVSSVLVPWIESEITSSQSLYARSLSLSEPAGWLDVIGSILTSKPLLALAQISPNSTRLLAGSVLTAWIDASMKITPASPMPLVLTSLAPKPIPSPNLNLSIIHGAILSNVSLSRASILQVNRGKSSKGVLLYAVDMALPEEPLPSEIAEGTAHDDAGDRLRVEQSVGSQRPCDTVRVRRFWETIVDCWKDTGVGWVFVQRGVSPIAVSAAARGGIVLIPRIGLRHLASLETITGCRRIGEVPTSVSSVNRHVNQLGKLDGAEVLWDDVCAPGWEDGPPRSAPTLVVKAGAGALVTVLISGPNDWIAREAEIAVKASLAALNMGARKRGSIAAVPGRGQFELKLGSVLRSKMQPGSKQSAMNWALESWAQALEKTAFSVVRPRGSELEWLDEQRQLDCGQGPVCHDGVWDSSLTKLVVLKTAGEVSGMLIRTMD